MCTFCTEHGLGDRWYFNFENYLFNKIYPTPEMKDELKKRSMRTFTDVDRYGDPAYNHNAEYLKWKYSDTPGQVITLEEANKVMEIAEEATKREDTIVVLSRCNCALAYRAKTDYRCIVFGIPITWSSEIGYQRYPNEGLTEFGGAEWRELRRELATGRKVPLKPEEAKELLLEWNKKGYHHTLVSRGLFPLIDGICNCEGPYCMRMRHREQTGVTENCLVKGHHVALIDPEKCNACGVCMMRCEFGAIHVSPRAEIAFIDPTACYGCGLCQTSCKHDAISMVAREKIPIAKDLW